MIIIIVLCTLQYFFPLFTLFTWIDPPWNQFCVYLDLIIDWIVCWISVLLHDSLNTMVVEFQSIWSNSIQLSGYQMLFMLCLTCVTVSNKQWNIWHSHEAFNILPLITAEPKKTIFYHFHAPLILNKDSFRCHIFHSCSILFEICLHYPSSSPVNETTKSLLRSIILCIEVCIFASFLRCYSHDKHLSVGRSVTQTHTLFLCNSTFYADVDVKKFTLQT